MRKNAFYAFIVFVVAGLAKLVYRIKVIGKENIPQTGGCLLCANHQSYIDIPAVALCTKRQVRFMAKAELTKSKLGRWFFMKLGIIPVRRGENDVKAIKSIVSVARTGEVTAIFPQGTRYIGQNPAETPVKPGVGMIALRADVPVIPVCIIVKGQKFRPFRRTTVIIGTPIPPKEYMPGPSERPDYEAITRCIFSHVCALGGFASNDAAHAAQATISV